MVEVTVTQLVLLAETDNELDELMPLLLALLLPDDEPPAAAELVRAKAEVLAGGA